MRPDDNAGLTALVPAQYDHLSMFRCHFRSNSQLHTTRIHTYRWGARLCPLPCLEPESKSSSLLTSLHLLQSTWYETVNGTF